MVLMIHNSKKKEVTEEHYSETLLFSSWRDERKDLKRNSDACFNEYRNRKKEIDNNRKIIYPGEAVIDTLESTELELIKMRINRTNQQEVEFIDRNKNSQNGSKN